MSNITIPIPWGTVCTDAKASVNGDLWVMIEFLSTTETDAAVRWELQLCHLADLLDNGLDTCDLLWT